MPMSARTVTALVGPTARAMNWSPLAVAMGLGLAIVLVPRILSDRLAAAQLTTLLRLAAACGALGVAFLLDDPATRSISTVPTSRLIRHAVRAGIAVPVAAAGWAAALAVSTLGAHAGMTAAVPRGALTLEAAALAAVALGLAAGGSRLSTDGSAGTLAAPALLILLGIVWFMPHRVALILAPTDPLWTSAHRRWAALLLAAVTVFICASRESSPPPRAGRAGRHVGRAGRRVGRPGRRVSRAGRSARP
jgi:hypothetical protein